MKIMLVEKIRCKYGGGGAAAAAAIIAEANKASGAIVKVEPEAFRSIVDHCEKPLIIARKSTFISTSYQYLTSYRGFIFYTRSKDPLLFKSTAEMVKTDRIWIPG
jgi:hypothetical protein